MVEQAHRPRTRRAPLHRGPLVHARAPSRQADRRGGEDTMSTTDPTRDQHERRQNAPEPTTDHSVPEEDRKSTRLNSSHVAISYAVFCLKKKKTEAQARLSAQQ